MEVLVKKGGIIEIPNSVMAELGICEGNKLFLNVKDGKILINPAKNIAERLAGSIALDDVDLIDGIVESEDWEEIGAIGPCLRQESPSIRDGPRA